MLKNIDHAGDFRPDFTDGLSKRRGFARLQSGRFAPRQTNVVRGLSTAPGRIAPHGVHRAFKRGVLCLQILDLLPQ